MERRSQEALLADVDVTPAAAPAASAGAPPAASGIQRIPQWHAGVRFLPDLDVPCGARPIGHNWGTAIHDP